MSGPHRRFGALLLCSTALTLLSAAELAAQQKTTVLDPILVQGSGSSTPGNSTVSGAAVVAVDAGDLDTALRNLPGTYTRSTPDNPGITVNIRGLQSFGRVNSMIDGIPQNARNMSGHAGTLNTLVFVDPGLLAGVEVTRGTVSGAEGMGTLGGSANFRTLDVADVLIDGHDSGALLRFGAGTNGKDWNATAAFAQRYRLGGGTLGLVGAISGFKETPYKDGNGVETTSTKGQSPQSFLLKADYESDNFGKLKISAMQYGNEFSAPISSGYVWEVETRSLVLNYSRDDLKLNAWVSQNNIAFPSNSAGTGGVYAGREGVNIGTGVDLSNVSRLELGGRPLDLSYGVAWSKDDYDGNAKSGANADGALTKSGAFVEARYDLDALRLTGGLRYDHWVTEGVTDYMADGTPAATDRKSGGKINPSLRLDWQASETTAVYGALSTTMRPPTASEMFYPGAVFAHSDVTSTAINNNPDLVPEEALNAELGLAYAAGPFSGSAALFRNAIEKYIGYSTDPSDGNLRWVNLPGQTVLSGLEMEGRYDSGRFYTSLALTLANTDKPLTTYPGMISDMGTLPDDYATLDIGMRWRDETVTTGLRVRHTGAGEVWTGTATPVGIDASTVVDLYASWQVRESFDLYANVENVTDAFYQTANAAFTETTGNLGGRGRTITIGGALKF